MHRKIITACGFQRKLQRSVQAAQNEAAIARQKLQDYYAQQDAAQNDVQDKDTDERSSVIQRFDDPGNTDDFGNTDDPENSDDSGNTDRTDGEGIKYIRNSDNSNAQDNSQEQALIDDIRAKEAVNEICQPRRTQSAEQAIRIRRSVMLQFHAGEYAGGT